MKTLYLDCGMGAAGDMLAAALFELVPSPDAVLDRLNSLGIPGVRFQKNAATKCGILGTHLTVTVNGVEEESFNHSHNHEHEHEHEHEYEHSHSGLGDIEHLVNGHLTLSQKIKDDVLSVYRLLAEAESHVHGVPVGDIHFHEVGTLDAVADITAVCLLMDALAPEQVIASPVHVGSGQVHCAHGILPVPAPATAHLLRGIPVYGGQIKGELCTPTGAALLKHFAARFGDMPVMSVEAVGYGMGTKNFEAANCVRAFLGETSADGGDIAELKCNLDDMTPEAVGFVQELLFGAGALDVYYTPIGMKKSRPGVLLCCLCKASDAERFADILLKNTSTLGVRMTTAKRFTLERKTEVVETSYGKIRIKIAAGRGIEKIKPEYEDVSKIAKETGKTFSVITELVSEAFKSKS